MAKSADRRRPTAAGTRRDAHVTRTCDVEHGSVPQKDADDAKMKDEAFAALGQLDAQRRGERAVEADAEAVVVLQPVEVEVRRARGDLAGVVEERGVEVAVDHDAPLRLQQQAVLIAEAPAAE